MKSFRGQPHEGKIKAGMEFKTPEARAEELELHGLAYRVVPIPQTKMETAPQNKMETAFKNKAASAGPLPSVGGKTGAENAPSLLDQDHQPPQRSSKGFGRGRGS